MTHTHVFQPICQVQKIMRIWWVHYGIVKLSIALQNHQCLVLLFFEVSEVHIHQTWNKIFAIFKLQSQSFKRIPLKFWFFFVIKDQKQCFEHIFNGLDFVNWKFYEFFGFDFADSFLDSWNDRFNVFGLAFDFFKLGIEKTGSIVGKFFDLVPLDLNFFEVSFTLKELFFEECKTLFNGGLDVDVMLLLLLIGFEKGLGEFLALIDGLSEFLDL